jgi:hypothetical protein
MHVLARFDPSKSLIRSAKAADAALVDPLGLHCIALDAL